MFFYYFKINIFIFYLSYLYFYFKEFFIISVNKFFFGIMEFLGDLLYLRIWYDNLGLFGY